VVPGTPPHQRGETGDTMARLAGPMSSISGLPPGVVCLADYELLARERMTPNAWAYVAGGGADEITLRANREAFDRLRLEGRVLRDFSAAHTRLSLLGDTLDYPVLLAPTAYQKLFHPDGEIATVQGATAMRAAMVVSTEASVSLEEVAAASRAESGSAPPPPLWFQLYVQRDRAFTRDLVQRVHSAGYRALVLTVDAPIDGVRNRQQRAGFHLPPGVEPVNLASRASAPAVPRGFLESQVFSGFLDGAATWKDIAWLRGISPLPLLLKGIVSPADAERAVTEDVSALIVSNHGGRGLDTLPAAIDALPRVADRVGGRLPLLVDGGIRRGTDIVKALALGASAVLIGRPYVHALAVAGALGVAHVLHILRAELEVAMTLTGCATLDQIDRSVLW
jgi:4-hydroxymandelate oxidase